MARPEARIQTQAAPRGPPLMPPSPSEVEARRRRRRKGQQQHLLENSIHDAEPSGGKHGASRQNSDPSLSSLSERLMEGASTLVCHHDGSQRRSHAQTRHMLRIFDERVFGDDDHDSNADSDNADSTNDKGNGKGNFDGHGSARQLRAMADGDLDFDGGRSDAESMDASVAYFDSADFVRADWTQSLNMIPPVGFAAVATGIAFLHPVIFAAGALTAFGAVHVVGVGYDWCMNPDVTAKDAAAMPGDADSNIVSTLLFCDRDTTSAPTAIAGAASAKDKSNPAGATRKQSRSGSFGKDSLSTVEDDWDNDDDIDPSTHTAPATLNAGSVIKESSTSPQSTATTAEEVPDTTPTTSDNEPDPITIPALQPIVADSGATAKPKTRTMTANKNPVAKLGRYEEIMGWVDQHYPQLANPAVTNQQFHGLNAKEFFQVFFADDAPYTYQEFQRQRQDKDILYEPWKDISSQSKPSMHDDAKPVHPAVQVKERMLKFQAKTKSFFGPPYAKTTKVQRAFCPSKRLLVIDSKTTVKEIPFCDRFYVLERWVITAIRHPTTRVYDANLNIYSQAVFTGSCPFESKIKSTSNSTICDIATSWYTMAQEALKLSEEHRFQRIRNEGSYWDESLCEEDERDFDLLNAENKSAFSQAPQCDNDCDNDGSDQTENDENVEVEHIHGRRSWVLNKDEDENRRVREERSQTAAASEVDTVLKESAVPANHKRLSSFERMGRSFSKMMAAPRKRRNSRNVAPKVPQQ